MPGRRLDLKTESNFYNIMYDVCCICTLTYMYSPHTIGKIIIHDIRKQIQNFVRIGNSLTFDQDVLITH